MQASCFISGFTICEYDVLCVGPILDNPMKHLSIIAQIVILLGAICHVVVGVRTEVCEFILSSAVMLIKLAMSTGLPSSEMEYNATQELMLKQLPTSLYTALGKFNIDGDAALYAVCPSCSYTYQPSYDPISTTPSYPTHCVNLLIGEDASRVCGTPLLENCGGQCRPIKPYLVSSFHEYLIRLLANGATEKLCDEACDGALRSLHNSGTDVRSIFQGEFMRTFEGPEPGKLFIDRGEKVRLAFAMHVDFFNPNGVRVRGNSDSIGVISLTNLNLPESIRLESQNIFLVAIIPGPRKPTETQINYYTRPIMEVFQTGWERGYHISQTASSPVHGRDVEVAIILSINDLPAAREVSGSAGHTSHFICTRCTLYHRENIHRIDHDQWQLQDTLSLRQKAEEWRVAESLKEKQDIFQTHHVRWSEFWRLPYWDPPRMLVTDPMHALLEGLVHYHCRRVLEIDAKRATEVEHVPAAFTYDWMPHSRLVPTDFVITKGNEIGHILKIQRLLTRPFNLTVTSDDPDESILDNVKLRRKLLTANKMPLKFICFSLNLFDLGDQKDVNMLSKEDLIDLLISWVCSVFHLSRPS